MLAARADSGPLQSRAPRLAFLGPVVVLSHPGEPRPPPTLELTTLADDEIVAHLPDRAVRMEGLEPDSTYEVAGAEVRTLARPGGELLARFATVNDLHFGEVECGLLDEPGLAELGPVLRSPPGMPPYPELMNRAAAVEIAAAEPDAVLVKGDLTADGKWDEFEAFLSCYGRAFGERLHYVRGNHDAMSGNDIATAAPVEVALPGVRLAMLDTVRPGLANGRVDVGQLEWLDELGARSDVPVMVFGHHHVWDPSSKSRPDGYFGVNPDDSEALVEVMARRPALVAYFAGHTHRNRVRKFNKTGRLPWVEVACTKDYPGSWAEYRVFDRGVLQVHRRISSPEAMRWSESCRALFAGNYPQYALGSVEDRCFALWTGAA